MAIYSRKNLYNGINAHLQSYFQNVTGWKSFHSRYINFLLNEILELLPSGYLADIETSLQISEYHPDTGEKIRRPEPDITLYRKQSPPSPTFGSSLMQITLELPLEETLELDEDLYLPSLMIYKTTSLENETLGEPVTRIEVLSPTNKPPGDGYLQYNEKRKTGLKSGVSLVEIDFLHETDSPIKKVPSYRRQHPHAFPYSIAVSNPHPTLTEGVAQIIGFHVDTPILPIAIPLAALDAIVVDFGKVYDLTYESNEAYSVPVDYEQLPHNLDSYSDEDKTRIQVVMARVKQSQTS